MKEYLLLFRNISGDNSYILTPQDMAEDMPAWQGWIGNIAMQGKLVATQPIEYQGTIINNEGIYEGPDKGGNNVVVAGFLICKADSPGEVEAWSKTCPILKYKNGSVEIRPIIPFPSN
ncbi:YciI family protein [Dyadobacter sp. 3J3]|uniref:YciI family protein n=1 Tax=Dyadobacter sp. 3J3 TaxID=2606600 RepID=UPI00135A8691|nr:YciI family protein [Dyadobacter sp. 3J3]